MIFKDKKDDIASKSFSRVLNKIIKEAKSGNAGLIFASTYTLNTRAQSLLQYGLSSLSYAMKSLTPSIVSLWLIPPPTHFSRSNYYKQHTQGILDLLKVGAFLWFDYAVHGKFLLFWSNNRGKLITHCRYFGSTNFTLGGLIKNIEEFHYDVSGKISNLHSFYFRKAIKYLDNIINCYKNKDFWGSLKIPILRKMESAASEIRTKIADAKETLEKLEVAGIGYLHVMDTLTLLWNLPGKKWAYDITESFLNSFDDPLFEMQFIEEIVEWPPEELDRFVSKWQIDTDTYLKDTSKLGGFIEGLKDRVVDYFERGYDAFLFDEEVAFINQLDLKKNSILGLKELQWTSESNN